MHGITNQDIFIGVAAVADYTPIEKHAQKIKKCESSLKINLIKTKDILADVASLPNPPFCVGFAAESEKLIEYASQKRIEKKLPLIVANDAAYAMGADDNQVILIDKNGTFPITRSRKSDIAQSILMHVTTLL